MAVGDVLLRLDLQTDRFNLVPAVDEPGALFTDGQPTGLTPPQRYGTKVPGRNVYTGTPDLTRPPSLDETPPPVAMLTVKDPQSIVRAQGADAPVVVAGDGEGLVDLAAAGLLELAGDPLRRLVRDDARPGLRALPADAVLVLTDSNRRRAQRIGLANATGTRRPRARSRWSTIRATSASTSSPRRATRHERSTT